MERLIFDTHAHYTSGAFNQNREELLESLPQEGVALVLTCGTDLGSSRENLALARNYDWMYVAAGIHPESLIEDDTTTTLQFKGDWRAEMKAMAPLFEDEKVVAVGEIGLDHHWPIPKNEQYELFEAEIRFAMERELPLSIHDREAHSEVYTLLKKYRPKGILHSYSGSGEDVKWLCNQGIYIGFSGVVTFKNARKTVEAAAAVPDEFLLLETDCPYMAPEPFRGRKSNSAMIRYTAARIAEIRGTDVDSILKLSLENGKRLFGV